MNHNDPQQCRQAQRHTDFRRRCIARQALPNQLEVAALHRKACSVRSTTGHRNLLLEDSQRWLETALICPVILIDAIVMKVRSGQVGNRPIYAAIGITVEGHRDVLGMWVGPTGGEGAKQWMNMLTELKNRGVQDVLIVCCDGLKGLPESIVATWPLATVQTCVVHLVRNSLRFASKKYWKEITGGLNEIYQAKTVEEPGRRFDDFAGRWEATYPAMIQSWWNSWREFTRFLDFPIEIRKLIYTTNAIESLNARFRAATKGCDQASRPLPQRTIRTESALPCRPRTPPQPR